MKSMKKSIRSKIKQKSASISLNKPISMTPLQAIKVFQKQNPIYKNTKIGYAGRLDPMAQGVLLLLINNENKKFNTYSKLDKEYIAEILLGISTRFLPHLPNFTAIGAIAIFSGRYLPNRFAWALPISIMFLSDIFIGHSSLWVTMKLNTLSR